MARVAARAFVVCGERGATPDGKKTFMWIQEELEPDRSGFALVTLLCRAVDGPLLELAQRASWILFFLPEALPLDHQMGLLGLDYE